MYVWPKVKIVTIIAFAINKTKTVGVFTGGGGSKDTRPQSQKINQINVSAA